MIKAAVLLFDQVEVLDFAGPFEVLSCAENQAGALYFSAQLLAEQEEVTCRGDMVVRRQGPLEAARDCGLVIVPGGPGVRRPGGQPALARAVAQAAAAGAIVASVCTGSYVLAQTGLLAGRRATTHAFRLAEFAAKYPDIDVVEEKVVDLGNILTAGGVASGIDLCLHLLERQFGPQARAREAARLQGPWT